MTTTAAAILALALMQTALVPPQAEIRLTLTCGATTNEVKLTLDNPGNADTAVLLGRVLANGLRYLPQELVIEMKRRGRADVEQLRYYPADLPGGFAGRIDHWVLALPAKASFALTLRAEDFISISPTGRRPVQEPPEELTVRLTGRPVTYDLNLDMKGLRLWRIWTGTAVSNHLRVAAECIQ